MPSAGGTRVGTSLAAILVSPVVEAKLGGLGGGGRLPLYGLKGARRWAPRRRAASPRSRPSSGRRLEVRRLGEQVALVGVHPRSKGPHRPIFYAAFPVGHATASGFCAAVRPRRALAGADGAKPRFSTRGPRASGRVLDAVAGDARPGGDRGVASGLAARGRICGCRRSAGAGHAALNGRASSWTRAAARAGRAEGANRTQHSASSSCC